ncbi:MAG: GNAT family N-acetyltransferase, partial [Acetobacteraceae bacterium]
TFTGRPGLYLEDIYVAPEHRGRGIGRALIRHLARLAEAEGCARIEWSVLDWNGPAQKFYATLGAEPMSEWTVQRLSGAALARLASADAESPPGAVRAGRGSDPRRAKLSANKDQDHGRDEL